MELLEPKLTCKSCRKTIYISWSLKVIRCPSCKFIYEVQRSEVSRKDLKNEMLEGSSNNSLKFNKHENVISKTGTNEEQGNGSSRGRICNNKISGHSSAMNSKPSISSYPSVLYKGRPKKRAVLCGVSYMKLRYRLKGTVSDVKNMRELLIQKFGFPAEGMRVLTEEAEDPKCSPTKKNIQEALKWLVENCESGDSLVFFFSGHGLRQPEFNGDEVDGYDETICPVDFKKEGMILDNYINSTIVNPLTPGVTLHAIVDACHSGTILDLPNVYNYANKKWDDNSPPSGAFKGTKGGKAISFSACGDNQMAVDTNALGGKAMSGAMTYSFIKAISKTPNITYGKLLTSMHEAIDEANNSKDCLNSRILSRVFHTKLFQEPQLSASEPFDIDKTELKL